MIIGHQKQWAFLSILAKSGNFSHAYLFSGQEKIGKKTLALEWLSLLFKQPIFTNNGIMHPDLSLIEPKEKEIQIAQIRELIWKLSLKPYSAPFKAAIIDKAHSMNEEAQSSLLKTLEEPRGKALLILISESPQYLLPTIISRVEKIKFYPAGKKEIKNYLKNKELPEEAKEEISRISCGRLGRAADFISDPQKLKEWEKTEKELAVILNSDIADKFQYAKELSQKDNLKEILEVWLAFFREKLMLKINPESDGKQYGKSSQGLDISKYPLIKIKNILSKIQTINYLIATTNVNTRLILETFMLDL
ncbi:MAG: hypothetical protein Q7S82_04035 [bacterium]|nr:hypothetical protein [bacterium]